MTGDATVRILLISASAREGKSQTFALAEEVGKGTGAPVETVHICGKKMEFCRHCEACHVNVLKCPIPDDVSGILQSMLSTDGIILATPNYINQVTAPMKTLMDRSSHFIHCKRLLDKYVVGVVSSGGGQDQDVLNYLGYYAHTCGAQSSGGISSRAPVGEEAKAEARRLGERLARDIRERTQYPDQTGIIQEGKKHFRRLIQLRKELWKGEYEYWKEKGWL